MALVDITNRILRSLCANTPEEQDLALENFSRVNMGSLDFGNRHATLLSDIASCYVNLGGPPSTSTLRDRFARLNEVDLSLLADEIRVEHPAWGAGFVDLLNAYVEQSGLENLKTLLTEASQIASDGLTAPKKQTKRGLQDSLVHLVQGAIGLQQVIDPTRKAMSNIEAVDYLRDEYITRMDQPVLAYGMTMGLTPLDEATKGAQPGELWMIGGYTSHGKTTLMLNWMRYLSVFGGFNVLIYTLEMTKQMVWRILACIHSSHPKWEGHDLLDYEKIKSGSLSKEDSSWYLNEVLPDLLSEDYGRIEVVQPSGKTTLEEIRAVAEVYNRQYPLDVLAIDYLQLVGVDPKNRNSDKRQGTNDNIAAAKQMALEFARGDPILIVSPHQLNRKGYAEAQKVGGVYELSALADNNEAERSSDGIITIYQDGPLRQKDEAVICHLKARDAHRVEPFNVYFPARHRLIGDLVTADTTANLELLLEA